MSSLSDTPDDSLSQKLDKVINDHFSDRKGMAISWFTIVDGLDSEGGKVWMVRYPENQSALTNLGLADFGLIVAQDHIDHAMHYDGDEDDD